MSDPQSKNPCIVAIDAGQFNPTEDAVAIRNALKGLGCDDKLLINIIPYRSNHQRQEISLKYKTLYGRDLIEDIDSKTSGNFKKLLVSLLTPTLDYYVGQLQTATKGLGTDEDILIEFLCGMPTPGIEAVKLAYERKFHSSLEKEIKDDTSGSFKRLMTSILTGQRDSNTVFDLNLAIKDAHDLYQAGESRLGTDESTFNMILCRRSFEHIRLINEEYVKLRGHPLEKAIENEFSGFIKRALRAICRCAIDKPGYFAQLLHKSMAGLGTNDDQLIRVIVCRAEFDLNEIKERFQKIYKKSLKSWIKGDTSGSYRDCLLAIIREL